MRLALVGCGYVADYYLATLGNHPDLELAGVHDRDGDRAERFARFHRVKRYASFEEVLSDQGVDLVVNLTNPASHFAVSNAALGSGKHVYTEKPLATVLAEAEKLVGTAESRGLLISSAPCTVLGEAAQTAWKALREGRIGAPRLAYAEMDDGPVPLEDHATWTSPSGAPWPAKDEFEVGCTLEHSGYQLSWLTAFFGPVRSVVASARVVLEDKGLKLDRKTPDFSVATLEFESGVVARLTCGIFASPDRRLRVFGDAGVLTVADTWDFGSAVRVGRRTRLGLKAEKHADLARRIGLGPRRIPLVRRPTFRWLGRPANRIDFCRGIAELAAAARERRASRLSARWCLHVNELALAIQDPEGLGTPHRMRSTFEPMQPMPWADG